jgi:hypothetical protein
MSVIWGALLALLLLPLMLIAAGVAIFVAGLAAAVACPVFLYLATCAADAHDWALMWHRLGFSGLSALVAIVILRPSMHIIARHADLPRAHRHPRAPRPPQYSDYLGAIAAGESVGMYMKRRATRWHRRKNVSEYFS